jgi:3-isopropylmalate/(R)-2-methylmalate dehydratase small subunit
MMHPFAVLTAVAAPLEIAKIDTGTILPGRFMRRHRRPGHDYSDAFLHDLRFDETGAQRPEFVLNKPAYQNAEILVTDSDFGCGSSREGAAYAVMDSGFRALIGPSFAEIFYGNCLQNGILPVELPEQNVYEIWAYLKAQPGAKVTIDLPNQQVVTAPEMRYPFEVNQLRKGRLIRGQDDIDATFEYKAEISEFDTNYRAARPWLPTAARY